MVVVLIGRICTRREVGHHAHLLDSPLGVDDIVQYVVETEGTKNNVNRSDCGVPFQGSCSNGLRWRLMELWIAPGRSVDPLGVGWVLTVDGNVLFYPRSSVVVSRQLGMVSDEPSWG